MKMRHAFLVVLAGVLISFVALGIAGCGGGGSEEVVQGRLTINNNCSSGSYDMTVNNTLWATLSPGQSISHDVPPGVYTVKECYAGTTTCISNTDTVSSRVEKVYNICD